MWDDPNGARISRFSLRGCWILNLTSLMCLLSPPKVDILPIEDDVTPSVPKLPAASWYGSVACFLDAIMVPTLTNTTSGNTTVLFEKSCRKDGLASCLGNPFYPDAWIFYLVTAEVSTHALSVASTFARPNVFKRSLLLEFCDFGGMSSK